MLRRERDEKQKKRLICTEGEKSTPPLSALEDRLKCQRPNFNLYNSGWRRWKMLNSIAFVAGKARPELALSMDKKGRYRLVHSRE